MDELFCCRNCIHNCSQSFNIGKGSGFCVKHDSVIFKPDFSTCKYLHRKDLPSFVVDEGVGEHAKEFATISGIAHLFDKTPIDRLPYSEKFVWERRQFDSINQSLAQYHKAEPSWVFLNTMSGGIDGRRNLTCASLIRRYMDNCRKWFSSYRFILSLVQEIATTPLFLSTDLHNLAQAEEEIFEETKDHGQEVAETSLYETDLVENVINEAIWDVFFTRISGIQEYGFHSGIENLMWALDEFDEPLNSFDWEELQKNLAKKSIEWTDLIIQHAVSKGVFFNSSLPPNEKEIFPTK